MGDYDSLVIQNHELKKLLNEYQVRLQRLIDLLEQIDVLKLSKGVIK